MRVSVLLVESKRLFSAAERSTVHAPAASLTRRTYAPPVWRLFHSVYVSTSACVQTLLVTLLVRMPEAFNTFARIRWLSVGALVVVGALPEMYSKFVHR